ncbi:MAG: 3-phosphoshikimate 1-carboxyvinyltransferase [Eubacteriales bacterium]|jgi:3-phosphoshikimate 1-carboxyvinyltransferase
MIIKPSGGLRGELTVAPDKSISHRGVMLGSIARGTTLIRNFLMGEDCLSTISCFRQMGVDIQIDGENVRVQGQGMRGLREPEGTLYTGNSGTTTRILCGLLAPQSFSSRLEGDASIARRPMGRVIRPLRQMGAQIEGREGEYTPLLIQGTPLRGLEYSMPVASAQLKSALLLAGLYAEGETRLHQPEVSRDHTERMLRGFGARVENRGRDVWLQPGEELYAGEVEVPADISSAAFFMVAGLIVPGSCIRLRRVGLNPTRTGIVDALRAMGGDITVENVQQGVEPMGDVVVRSSSLHGIRVEGELIPRLIDELPALAVAAAFAQGTTEIRDAQELKVKESNRIDAMARELVRAGADAEGTVDGLMIRGGKPLHGAKFHSYGDHRVAMSMTVLALAAQGESQIEDPGCIAISYPGFAGALRQLGGEVDG